jgi:hypothetical protein
VFGSKGQSIWPSPALGEMEARRHGSPLHPLSSGSSALDGSPPASAVQMASAPAIPPMLGLYACEVMKMRGKGSWGGGAGGGGGEGDGGGGGLGEGGGDGGGGKSNVVVGRLSPSMYCLAEVLMSHLRPLVK